VVTAVLCVNGGTYSFKILFQRSVGTCRIIILDVFWYVFLDIVVMPKVLLNIHMDPAGTKMGY